VGGADGGGAPALFSDGASTSFCGAGAVTTARPAAASPAAGTLTTGGTGTGTTGGGAGCLPPGDGRFGSIASTSTGIEPRPRLPSFTAAV